MFRILVVDDEYPIREWLVYTIQSNYSDIQVESAKNGLEALEKLRGSSFDLVITDICMPHMGGIELLQEIQENLPQTNAIVLSSYDDYNFVRNAFKNRAVDYMLKTDIDSEKFLETIDNFRSQKNSSRDLSVLAQRISAALLENTENKDSFLQLLSSHGDFIPSRDYFCFFMKFHQAEDVKDIKPFLPFVEDTKLRFCLSLSLDLYVGCVEILHSSLLVQLQRQAAYIKQLQRSNALSLLLYSDLFSGSQNLLECLQSLFSFRDLDFYGVTVYTPAENARDQELYMKEKYLYIMDSIRKNDVDAVRSQIDEFLAYAVKVLYPNVTELKYMCVNLCESIYLNNRTMDLNEYHQYTKSLSSRFLTTRTNEQLRGLLTDTLEKLCRRSCPHNGYSPRIAQSISIIEKNYMKEISLVSVAQSLFVSPEYLSRSFKKEVGINFNTYLNNIRLQNALSLLKEQNCRISEISEKTGFQSPAYFSKCFKAAFGVSPQEWKASSLPPEL